MLKEKMKNVILVLVCCATLLLQGCVYRYPVSSRPHISPVIGSTVETVRPLYLANEGRDHYLLPDDDPIYRAPRFDDFRSGKYKSKFGDRFKFTSIVPSGTPFDITTVWEKFHMEIGSSLLVYGRFPANYPGKTPRKVRLWSTMSTNVFNPKDMKYFRIKE